MPSILPDATKAGVSPADHGLRPSWSMRWAGFWRGVWFYPSPRLITKKDFSRFDLIVAMDRQVLFSIKSITKNEAANVKLLSDFLPENSPIDVPDPMNRSVPTCYRVLDMLETACGTISHNVYQAAGSSALA